MRLVRSLRACARLVETGDAIEVSRLFDRLIAPTRPAFDIVSAGARAAKPVCAGRVRRSRLFVVTGILLIVRMLDALLGMRLLHDRSPCLLSPNAWRGSSLQECQPPGGCA
jgi:hypothetical protein